MTAPLISVCIPTYNHERFIQEAIESVLSQDFTDFELMIIDDCSTDRTGEIVRRFAARDSRIRFIENPRNIGMVPNWNRCLELAQGIYVKFLFGDDLLISPDALTRMVTILEQEPDVSLVASARIIVDEDSLTLNTLSEFPDGSRLHGTELISSCLDNLITQHNPIGEPSVVMFRQAAVDRGFDKRYSQLVDLEMWFHLLEQGGFAYIGEPLCAFRSHSEQQTVKNQQNFIWIADLFCLLEDYLGRPYTGVGPVAKRFAIFEITCVLWKEMRGRGGISLREINCYFPFVAFFFTWILYRLFVPFRNISRSIAKRWRALQAAK